MKTKIAFLTFALLCLIQASLPSDAAAARRPRWEFLGERTVTDRADHDVIPVTAARGTFRALKIFVKDRAVQFPDIKVHFADGETQDLAIRNVIPAGGESRVIDVRGRDRVIRSVEFRYDAQSLFGKSARVQLFGLN
jgi:hypothetical protein